MTPTQQLTAQPGQPLFTKSTKFNDLPDNVKKTFEDIEYAGHCCWNLTTIQLVSEHISRGESRSAKILSNVKSEKKRPKVKIRSAKPTRLVVSLALHHMLSPAIRTSSIQLLFFKTMSLIREI